MLRKIFAILIFAVGAFAAAAQNATGWYKYPSFNGTINNLIVTPEQVYFRATSNLFAYSEGKDEMFVYSTDNDLSDVGVKEIYYNPQKKYLAVAYDNGNIDLIYDNGKVYNLPDIKDANVYAPRVINSISFYDDEMYVATDFGFVVFDTNRYQVKKSAVFNEKVGGITRSGDTLVIFHDKHYKSAPASLSHYKKEDFTPGQWETDMSLNEMYPIGDTGKLCIRMNESFLFIMDAATLTYKQHGLSNFTQPLRPALDGSFYTSNGMQMVVVSPDGTFAPNIDLITEFQSKPLACGTSPEQLWCGSGDGISKYDATGTLLAGPILPTDCITLDVVNLMSWSPDYERLYITRTNPDKGRPGSLNSPAYAQQVNIIENLSPRDASIIECTLPSYNNGIVHQNANGDKRLYGGNYWVVENPYDKDVYFTSSNWNGAYAIKNRVMLVNINSTNSKWNNGVANRAQGIFIDPKNNLWVATMTGGTSPSVQMLPAKFLQGDAIKNITKSDWQTTPAIGYPCDVNFSMLFSTTTTMAYIHNGNWGGGLFAYDTKGTYADLSDDQGKHHTSFTDQDDKSFSPIRITSIAEDKNGQIWVGNTSGVFVITDPSKGLSDNFTVRRPKVARNDGTNFADYLVESDAVLWISVDPANNKWLATESSGLYLVNADGTEILAHYTTDNSPLASNTIYAVEQDPNSNLVYVATSAGFYRFYCSTAPAAEDFSEIYAYPNPVKPDYTGWITIKGLTEGALVKIVDAGGGLVAQTTANGGIAIWDGCNMQGARVRSGVYYVFASSGPNDEQGKGAVTKIIVIN